MGNINNVLLYLPLSRKIYKRMARACELTGKKVMSGNNVSHSKRRTKRKFYPNLISKKFYIQEEDKWVDLKISTSALRTIDKIGISAALKDAREKGF